MEVKFYYNGIKIDGKMYFCDYYKTTDIDDNECLIVRDRDYSGLPGIGWAIRNDTDIMTDYFECEAGKTGKN